MKPHYLLQLYSKYQQKKIVISDSVIRAVSDSNLTTTVPVETVAQAASTDRSIHSAYRELLRTRVQQSLRENPDFTPERFPNASNFFNVK